MVVKKDLTEKLNVLVDYIQSNTENGDWVNLTYRDIGKLAQSTPGSSTTKRLMDSLKEHENILFKIDLDPRRGKKPLQFKYVDSKTKFDTIDNKRYKNLTTDEVDYIKNKLGYKDHRDIYSVLVYVNYLKSEYHEKPFDLPDPAYISDVLLILEQDVLYMNEFLFNANILIDNHGKYSLLLKEVKEEKTPLVDTENTEHFLPVDSKMKKLVMLKEHHDSLLNEVFHELKSKDQLVQQKEHLAEEKQKEIIKMQSQLAEGHSLTQRLVNENQALKDAIKDITAEKNKMQATLDRTASFKTELVGALQDYLQVFNWQVQQIAVEDSKQSITVKNNNVYRAKLSQQYADVGNDLYNSVLEFINR